MSAHAWSQKTDHELRSVVSQETLDEIEDRIQRLESALRHLHDSHHKQPCICWIKDLLS